MARHVVFTVTNDLNFDQRMQRIAGTLATNGWQVTLVGAEKANSPVLTDQPFAQHRIPVRFPRGKAFYLEFNLKLLWWLLRNRFHIACAIDLDTILPVYLASVLKRKPRVYDAHELFCEMKEVVTRPVIHKIWKSIEQFTVPKFRTGYTVNEPIACIFEKDYGVRYKVIRNVPILAASRYQIEKEPFLLYQGAVNEGRLFEVLIPAMMEVDLPLHIYGDGNFLEQVADLISRHNLQHKVFLKGKCAPAALKQITAAATLGFTLFEHTGLSNYYSLANRFFDYVHAATPQICVDFPVYRSLNSDFPVAVLVSTTNPHELANEINKLLRDRLTYQQLQQNCLKQRLVWNWEQEEQELLRLYENCVAQN